MDNLSTRLSIREPSEEQSNFFNKGWCVTVWQPAIPQFSRSKHLEELSHSLLPEHAAICNFYMLIYDHLRLSGRIQQYNVGSKVQYYSFDSLISPVTQAENTS